MNTIFKDQYGPTETFTERQVKRFLKAIQNNRYEPLLKLIMTYQISRAELISLEWEDVDFDNNTITLYPISTIRNEKTFYAWEMTKLTEYKRTLPLLPSIKNLLIELKNKQQINSTKNPNFDFLNENFVCLKNDGTRMNINTLSRNLRYVARDNNLPQILLSGLKLSLDNVICKLARDYDFYRAWTRYDCKALSPKNIYKHFILHNKRFINALDDFISCNKMHSKSDMEM
ncbi:MAG: hypothetical protein RR140_00045 [Clostridia bacterium]